MVISASKLAQLKVLSAMDKAKLNYSALSRMIGVSHETVRGWINKKSMSIKDVEAISDAMGYDLEINLINRETGEKL